MALLLLVESSARRLPVIKKKKKRISYRVSTNCLVSVEMVLRCRCDFSINCSRVQITHVRVSFFIMFLSLKRRKKNKKTIRFSQLRKLYLIFIGASAWETIVRARGVSCVDLLVRVKIALANKFQETLFSKRFGCAHQRQWRQKAALFFWFNEREKIWRENCIRWKRTTNYIWYGLRAECHRFMRAHNRFL